MADDEDETSEPVVEVGDGPDVPGAPVARIASRLTWPQEASRIVEKEGDAEIRTPNGPRTVADVMSEIDRTYFDRQQTFLDAVESVVGNDPVATADEN